MAHGDPLAPEETLWRRCSAHDIKEDGSAKSTLWRSKDGVSVHRSHLTTIEAVTSENGCLCVFEIHVAELLELGLTVIEDTEGHAADHALVLGLSNSNKAGKVRDRARKIWPTDIPSPP